MIIKDEGLRLAALKFCRAYYKGVKNRNFNAFKSRCRREYGFEYLGRREFYIYDEAKVLMFALKWS